MRGKAAVYVGATLKELFPCDQLLEPLLVEPSAEQMSKMPLRISGSLIQTQGYTSVYGKTY